METSQTTCRCGHDLATHWEGEADHWPCFLCHACPDFWQAALCDHPGEWTWLCEEWYCRACGQGLGQELP